MKDPVIESPQVHAATVASNEAVTDEASPGWEERPWVVDFMAILARFAAAGFALGIVIIFLFLHEIPSQLWLETILLCFFGAIFWFWQIKAIKRRDRLAWYAILLMSGCSLLLDISYQNDLEASLKTPLQWNPVTILLIWYWLKPATKAWFGKT